MKIIFILFLASLSLFSKSNESCYTVQLMSKFNSKKNLELLHQRSFPNRCKLMEIGKSLTVRCGCFEKYVEAKEELPKFKKDYKIAVIATTYKYRFDDSIVEKSILNILKPQKNPLKKRAKDKRDEELRLILQVFLYKNDLKNAYKVAKLGYKTYSNSYYWNQKMAEISKWTSHSALSMKHLRNMYNIQRNSKIEKELIAYGTSTYQYEEIEPLVINRARANPSEKNIDLMLLVYKKIGSPEKVIAVLDEQYKKDKTNTMLLSKSLSLSLEMGDLILAKKYVDKIEKNKPYSKKDSALIARYYYVTHDIQTAYQSLSYVRKDENTHLKESVKYYELKSDLGWYLQYNKASAEASKSLMDMNQSRLIDYERVSFVYQKTDPKLASYATKYAYEKYKLSYLFYSYANSAINSQNYDELNALLNDMESESRPIIEESLYWMIKAKVYGHYKKRALEREALNKAASLEPDNYQIKLELLWLYMDLKDNEKLTYLLEDMSEKSDLDRSYYLPLASAYFSLNNINMASYYTNELILNDDPIIKRVEFKFLQAYIYQIQNNENAFINYMQDIESQLRYDAKENPKLKKQNNYLSSYLRAAIFVLNPDKFEKRLKKAKKYLSKKNYREISYSWAMKNSAYEKTVRIYHKMDKKELWVQFSNAIVFQNHSKIENLLDIYLHSLSMGDAAQVSQSDGQTALSQTITFETLLKNEKNQNAYIQHLDLSKIRTDKFSSTLSYYDRNPLLQKYIVLKNQIYLQSSFYLYNEFSYYKNSSLEERLLSKVPRYKLEVSTALKKLYKRGFLTGVISYHEAIQSYIEFQLEGNYRLSTDLYAGIKIGKNVDALESTQLLLGGKKDLLTLEFSWHILNSVLINSFYEYSHYQSQDKVNLGSSHYSKVTLSKEIKYGYPDMKVDFFYERGIYNETFGSRGVIDKMQSKSYVTLPQDFYNVGVHLYYGLANSDLYTRVWRPYLEFYPYYNSAIENYTYGFVAGYGGKIWHQDHLVFGASYSDSINGVGGSVLELFINYKFMYYHP